MSPTPCAGRSALQLCGILFDDWRYVLPADVRTFDGAASIRRSPKLSSMIMSVEKPYFYVPTLHVAGLARTGMAR